MTGRIEKTVFISYRRTNLPWALFVYQNLTMHGYDVFFDYQSIDSGNFESVILDNIRARSHFIVILTPSALENCNKPGDWLRREIETAMEENRNIVPLMVENFDFGSPLVKEALIGKLSTLSTYNGLPVPNAYALEAMERLRERYLNKAISNVPTPVLQPEAQIITESQKYAANEAAPVQEEQLTAQTWFERGYVSANDKNFAEAIRCYTEAIRLEPELAVAYNNRGNIYSRDKGDTKSAIKDYDKAIRLKPDYADAYNNRGNARSNNNDLQGALADYDEAIRLKPDYADAYNNRGITRSDTNDLQGALSDYDEAIRLKPSFAIFYYNRARVWESKRNFSKAIADYQKYLELGGGIRDGDQKEVEDFIKKLKSKLIRKKTINKKQK